MIKFKQTRPEGGDCTSSYDVILDKDYTVLDFIFEIVRNRKDEWSYFHIQTGKNTLDGPEIEYRYGETLSGIPEKICFKKIKRVWSNGGWSAMDYFITLED